MCSFQNCQDTPKSFSDCCRPCISAMARRRDGQAWARSDVTSQPLRVISSITWANGKPIAVAAVMYTKYIHKVPTQFSKQRLSLYFMSPNYSWNQLHWISWTHVNTFLFAASPMIPMLLESPKQDPLPSGNSATKRPSWPLQSCHWPLQNATRSPRLPQAVHRDTASAFLRRLHVAPAGTAATKWIEMMDPEFGFEVWLKTKTGEWRSKVMTEGIKHNFLPPHCNIHPSTFTPPADLRGGSSSMLSSQHLFDTAKDVSKACYKNPLHTQEAKGRGILQGPFISTHRRAW